MTTVPAPTPKERWRKIGRRAAIVGVALFTLCILFLLLLPVWISNDQGRAYILDRMNARLNGPRIMIDKWSLGWFSSTDLTNIRILQPDGTEMLSCPHVTSGITLWDLFRGNYDLRNTTADNLELRLTKFADGSGSMDALTSRIGGIMRSARGALQIQGGRLTIASSKSGQMVRFVDVRTTITFAAPEAPLQMQFSAVGDGSGRNGTGSVTINGIFPPSGTLNARSLKYPNIWMLLGNLDVTASRVPTALVCDYAGLDGAWADSLGDMLETVQISSHPTATLDASKLAVTVKGTGPGLDPPGIDALLLLRMPAPGKGARRDPGMLSISSKDYHADAALRWSAPLAELLGRLNPMLGEAATPPASAIAPPAGAHTAEAHLSITAMAIPLDRLSTAEATGRISFPPLVFVPHEGPSMVRQLQVVTGELAAARPSGASAGPIRIEGSVGVLRAHLADGRIAYENFLVALGKHDLNFQGEVGLDGVLNLSVLIPEEASVPLSSGSSRVAIAGTVDSPLVKQAP